MSNEKGYIESNEYKEALKKISERFQYMIVDLEANLSKEMIDDIKQWRVGNGPDDITTHSWREIASLFVDKYPEFSHNHSIVHGNQISGMHLCNAAMNLLNEKTKDGWN